MVWARQTEAGKCYDSSYKRGSRELIRGLPLFGKFAPPAIDPVVRIATIAPNCGAGYSD
jgi:hypothetical protein